MLTLRAQPESMVASVAAARALLVAPSRKDGTLPVLGAAALCAVCAVALAGSVILGPPGQGLTHATAPSIRSAF